MPQLPAGCVSLLPGVHTLAAALRVLHTAAWGCAHRLDRGSVRRIYLTAADMMRLCCAVLCAVAVHQDTNLWHKLAMMSEEQGYIRQAIYCWNKVGIPPWQHSR